MNRFPTLIVFLLLSFQIDAQTLYDSAVIDYENKQYEEGLKKINKVILNYPEKPEYFRLQGEFFEFLYKTEKATEAYFKAITLESSEKSKDYDFLGETHYYLSGCYYRLGQFQTSIRHCKQGLSYQPADNIKSNLRYNLSSSFARLGDYDSAMFYLNTSYEYDLKTGDSVAIATDLNSLGYMQAQKGAYEKALQLYKESLEYLDDKKSRQIAVRLSNIGMIQYRLRNFNEAEKNLIASKSRYEALNDSIKIITQLTNLSKVYQEVGQIEKAEKNLKIADVFFEQAQNVWAISKTKLQLGQFYLDTGHEKLAMEQVNDGIAYCKIQGLLEQEIELLDLKEKILLNQNQQLSAYSVLRERLKLADSLSQKQQLNKVNELELQFMTQIKEKQLELSKAQNQISKEEIARQQRNILILVIGTSLLVVFFLVVYNLQRQKMKLKESLHDKEVDELRIQISTLLGQHNEVKIPDFNIQEINEKLIEPLSEREFEILRAISSKMSNREIADSIFISINTVKFHLKNVYEKLGVSNRKEALHFLLKTK